jgi:Ca2+-binding EF-hand superfamily protein
VRQRIREKELNLREAFEAFDEDKNGLIDVLEFQRTFRIMDLGLTENEIERLQRWFDPNMTGRINYREFVDKLMGQTPRPAATADSRDPKHIMEKLGQNIRELQISLREAFEVFDTNKDGKIQRSEFFKVFIQMKINLSNADIEILWESLPKDKDDCLLYHEFCASMEPRSVASSAGTSHASQASPN